MNTFALLKKISAHKLSEASSKEIVEIACAYWHEQFLPELKDIESLPLEQQKVIGYMTEFFSTFNCVDKEQAMKLINIANTIKKHIQPFQSSSNTDEIAAEWGLIENLNNFHKDILQYQTRHYQHPQRGSA